MNVIESCKYVVAKAKNVKINEDNIKEISRNIYHELKTGKYDLHSWKNNPLHRLDATEESYVNWIFLVDSINFSFWSERPYTLTWRGKGYSGYWSLCAALRRALDKHIPITDPRFYTQMTRQQLEEIFATDQGIHYPMLEERFCVMREVGTVLINSCIVQAGCSAAKLLGIVLENFPSFRDEASYDGRKVYFYKRAQILIADIYACFENRGLGFFKDIDCLTMFADYRIPQVLVYLGAISYSDELNEYLRSGKMMVNGEADEVEIRAATVCTVDSIKNFIKSIISEEPIGAAFAVNSVIIDYYLWEYKVRPEVVKEIEQFPVHKVRCVYY